MKTIKSLMVLAFAVTTFVACSSSDDDNNNTPAPQYNVSGTWFAEYDATGIVGGGGQMEYTHLITACTLNDNGTGTWYKFMLTDESGEPIALDGGVGHGDFTYSVGTDGKIACKLTWSQAPSYYPSTLTFAASGDIIKGQEGTVAYDMKKASENMKAWIAEWANRLNGGGNAGGTGVSIAATTADIGKVIGTDGKIYRDAAAATSAGTVATAMIAYVGSQTGDATYKHGLAIALSDEINDQQSRPFGNRIKYSDAWSYCARKDKYAGAKWCVPTIDQWKQMIMTNGGDEESITGLNEAITAAGGTAMQESAYLSNTVVDDEFVWIIGLDEYDFIEYFEISIQVRSSLRACLVF